MLPRFALRFLKPAHWAKPRRELLVRWNRGVLAGVMLSCYLLVLCGTPLPGPAAITDASRQPYPCEDGTCGCGSAEQCWRSCCCYTDQQKLAWAKQNEVTPPADFLKRLTARDFAEAVSSPRSCCASKEPERNQSRVLITIDAFKCRGLGTDWTSLGDVIPPTSLEVRDHSPLLTDASLPAWAGLPEISFPPALPPPRG